MNMPIGAHHHTGITLYTTLFINIYNTSFISFNSPADTGVEAGCIITMPAGIEAGYRPVDQQ
jgi:hypothetical protein